MSRLLSLMLLIGAVTSSLAENAQTSDRIAMRIGSDANMFHHEFYGRTIWVDLYYYKIPSNVQCSPGLLCDVDYEAVSHMVPDNLANNREWTKLITLGRSRNFERNAFSVMQGTRRYIVFGTRVEWGGAFFGQDEFLLTLGHEIGHHVCGHTAEYRRDRSRAASWKIELEADEFAGAAVRQYEKWTRPDTGRFAGTQQYDEGDVLEWSLRAYRDTIGSDSHPPQHLRSAAVLKGFRSGVFPCSGAALLTVAPPTSPLPSVRSDASEIVRAFYAALGNADGLSASLLLVPEKRAGPFGAAEITKFYGSLIEPLHLISVVSLGDDKFQADYSYRARRRACDGSAVVTIVRREGRPLIEAIKALKNC